MRSSDRLGILGFSLVAALAGCSGSKKIIHTGDPNGEMKPPGGMECGGELGESPSLRRLTQTEYNNTVRDLIGEESNPANAFAPDPEVYGFRNNSNALSITQLLASQLWTASEEMAQATVDYRLARVLTCTPGDDCAHEFIQKFGKRAWRRPIRPDEENSLFLLYKTGDSFTDGVRLVIQRALLSPHFLYRREAGDPNSTPTGTSGVVPLTQYEIASRLSYFLLQTMPDEQLFAEADAGRLDNAENIAAQARRLLDDPRAHTMVDDFHDQWLGISKVMIVPKDEMLFPDFTEGVRYDMFNEARLFLSDVFWRGADARTILTSTDTWLTQQLANYYGAGRMPGPGHTPSTLPPGQERAGVLSMGAIMATYSYHDQISPVHRGKFVRNRLLCMEIAPPPPDVNATPPAVDVGGTLRERWSQHTSDENCAACHRQTDPIGFGTMNIDAAGRWQSSDNGKEIDVSGEVAGFKDPKFRGIAELGKKLADDESMHFCVTLQWLRYALGRLEVPSDLCTIDKLTAHYAASGLSMRELVVLLVQSDAFRYRRVVTPDPGQGG